MIGRIATEMLAGLITGGGIGWMLDQWLQTTPLFMLVLFILGGVAGMLTVWRMAMGYGIKIGYDRQSLTGNRENQNLTKTPDSDVATSQVENTDTKSNTANTTQTEQAD